MFCLKFMQNKNFYTHNQSLTSHQGFKFIDTIERLKSISRLTEYEWLDLIELSWKNYQQFRMGFQNLNHRSLDQIGNHFKISPEDIILNKLNFRDIAVKVEKNEPSVTDYYMVAPYSRRRTTITSIEFLEETYGWRIKQDVLKNFSLKESALIDPFAPISMRLITEICSYLKQRQFNKHDFYSMGAYTVKGNRNSILAKTLAQADSVQSLYHHLINNMMSLFETNSEYKYVQINTTEGIATMKSVGDIANELNVRYLGNEQICQLKVGFCASIPSYLGLPFANVQHIACEHKGDPSCVFKIDLQPCLNINNKSSSYKKIHS